MNDINYRSEESLVVHSNLVVYLVYKPNLFDYSDSFSMAEPYAIKIYIMGWIICPWFLQDFIYTSLPLTVNTVKLDILDYKLYSMVDRIFPHESHFYVVLHMKFPMVAEWTQIIKIQVKLIVIYRIHLFNIINLIKLISIINCCRTSRI